LIYIPSRVSAKHLSVYFSKKTWRKIVKKDCKARKLNREDAMDRNGWKKQIRDDR